MFREMRRKKQQMSDEEARGILAGATSGVLALAGESDYPYAVPMSFFYDEEECRLLFHTARVGHKMTAIERCDKASFCVIAEDTVASRHTIAASSSSAGCASLRATKKRGGRRSFSAKPTIPIIPKHVMQKSRSIGQPSTWSS